MQNFFWKKDVQILHKCIIEIKTIENFIKWKKNPKNSNFYIVIWKSWFEKILIWKNRDLNVWNFYFEILN